MNALTVKLWQITLNDGSKQQIFAPNKRLAKLNLMANVSLWSIGIKSIALVKQNRPEKWTSLPYQLKKHFIEQTPNLEFDPCESSRAEIEFELLNWNLVPDNNHKLIQAYYNSFDDKAFKHIVAEFETDLLNQLKQLRKLK